MSSYKRKTKIELPSTLNQLPVTDKSTQELLESLVKEFHGHPLFLKYVAEIGMLYSVKNKQYATKAQPLGNFIRTGKLISKMLKPGINPTLASCLCLVAKQIDGVYEIVGEMKSNTVEALEDKMRDVAVYFIIAMCICEEIKQGNIDYK